MSVNRLQLAMGCGIVLLSVFECVQAYPEYPLASNFVGIHIKCHGGWCERTIISSRAS